MGSNGIWDLVGIQWDFMGFDGISLGFRIITEQDFTGYYIVTAVENQTAICGLSRIKCRIG